MFGTNFSTAAVFVPDYHYTRNGVFQIVYGKYCLNLSTAGSFHD